MCSLSRYILPESPDHVRPILDRAAPETPSAPLIYWAAAAGDGLTVSPNLSASGLVDPDRLW